jgi:hypothetical protein
MVIGNSDYHWAHEPILYLGHGKERPIFHGDRTNKTVLDTVGDIAKLPKEKLLEILSDLQSTVIRVRKDSITNGGMRAGLNAWDNGRMQSPRITTVAP